MRRLLTTLSLPVLGAVGLAQGPEFRYPVNSAVKATGQIETLLQASGIGNDSAKVFDVSAQNTITSATSFALAHNVSFSDTLIKTFGQPDGCTSTTTTQIQALTNENTLPGLDYAFSGGVSSIQFAAALSQKQIATVQVNGSGGGGTGTVSASADFNLAGDNALRVAVPFLLDEEACLLIPALAHCLNRRTCDDPGRGITRLNYRIWIENPNVGVPCEFDSGTDILVGNGTLSKGNQLDSCGDPIKCKTQATVLGPYQPLGPNLTYVLEMTFSTTTYTHALTAICPTPTFGFDTNIHEMAEFEVFITQCPE